MEKNNNEQTNGLIAKWGNALFDDGITNLPECFSRYGIRFVTPGEFVFIVEVFSYQYTRDLPYPSQQTIAENMTVSVRQIQKYVKSLEDKGLLKVYYRSKDGKRTSNKYSFASLINKCLQLSIEEKAKNEDDSDIKETEKRPTRTTGTPRSLPEPQVRLDGEPQVRLDGEPQVRPNKEIEERTEERNMNKVCVDENRRNEVLSLIDSRSDLKPHTHTILSIFDKKSSSKNFRPEVFLKTLEIVDVDIKGINYLKTALQNNLKKGYVQEFSSGDKQSKKPIRTEKIPERMKAEVEIPEQKAVSNEPNLNPNETMEEKMKRLRAEQEEKFKTNA